MTKLKNILIAAVSLVTFSNITYAQSINAADKVKTSANADEPLNVKYIGDDGEYLIFQVTVQLNSTERGRFAIDDKYYGQIFSSVLRTNSKLTTVKIEKSDADDVLDFKLVLGKKTYSKSFSVNTSLVETTTVEEGDVTRL
jgi:hypothetical protein